MAAFWLTDLHRAVLALCIALFALVGVALISLYRQAQAPQEMVVVGAGDASPAPHSRRQIDLRREVVWTSLAALLLLAILIVMVIR